MKQILDFEKPIFDLKDKIDELKKISKDSEIDLREEINTLEERLAVLEDDIYSDLNPWNRVQIARHQQRPTTLDYVYYLFDDFIEFFGDSCYGDDCAIVSVIPLYDELPLTLIVPQRGENADANIKRHFGVPHTGGYREAVRHMRQAETFNRPIVTFSDTKGAEPGKAAEERGQSVAIADSLKVMAGLKVPVISIVIGEGGSGGAIALGVGSHVH